MKLTNETRKIFHDPNIAIAATCVRVPTYVSHAAAVFAELSEPMSAQDFRDVLSTAPGVAYAYLADYRRTRPDIFHVAQTVTGLAARLGVSREQLAQTVAAAQERGALASETHAPLFALGPAKAYIVFTNGGLKVSPHLEVLRADGSPIAGLYAAGSNGQGGLLLEGHGHHLMWAFASGRLAGRRAAFGATSSAGAA